MAKQRATIIVELIEDQVKNLLATDEFSQWESEQSFNWGDLVLFNNSFLLRGKSGTVKSDKYLAVRIEEGGRLTPRPLIVYEPGNIINDIKRFSGRQISDDKRRDIRDEVNLERRRLGAITLSLVAGVQPDEPASVEFSSAGAKFDKLVYFPGQEKVVELIERDLIVNQIDNSDVLWHSLPGGLFDAGHELDFEFSFRRALSKLRREAHISVSIDSISDGGSSILTKVVERLERQVVEYGAALKRHQKNLSDAEAKNELLRIAYNFADGAQGLTRLVFGISDLKPVAFWMTINAQFALKLAFDRVPLNLPKGTKPSFEKYRSVIANARNQVFHDIFSLGRTFKVNLPSKAFSGAEMLIFRDYSDRKSSALNFDDRRIVELLEGLTRTTEEVVPFGFWEANLDVMSCTVSVISSLRDSLLVLGGDRL